MKPCSKTKEIGGKSYRCFFELTLIVIGGKRCPLCSLKARKLRMKDGEK